jgi:beta-1,3-galactosyltransferase 1
VRLLSNTLPEEDERFRWLLRTREVKQYVLPDVITAILDPNVTCSDTLRLVILVSSAPNNTKERQAVRDTWGYAVPLPYTRLLFFLGHDGNSWPPRTTESVLSEAQRHGDIVVEDFTDSYNNLTLKSVFMLKWVVNHCSSVPFVLKTDDDMLINVQGVLKELTNNTYKPSQPMIFGKIQKWSRPYRSRSSKWYLPFWLYPEKYLPTFASGTGYVMTRRAVADIYAKSVDVPLIPLEDVFITGLVASNNLHIPLINVPRFLNDRPWLLQPCLYHHLLTAHDLKPSQLKDLWTALKALNPATCDSYYARSLAFSFGKGRYEVITNVEW